jgi:hypothetical protein
MRVPNASMKPLAAATGITKLPSAKPPNGALIIDRSDRSGLKVLMRQVRCFAVVRFPAWTQRTGPARF